MNPSSERSVRVLTRREICQAALLAGVGTDGLRNVTARPEHQIAERKVQWQSAIDTQASPAIDDERLYVTSTDTNVYAFDSGTGSQEWTFGTTDDLRTAPTVRDGTVYVANAENRVYAIEAATGAEQWRFSAESFRSFTSPAVSNGRVFVSSGRGYVYALDAATGTQEWQSRPDENGSSEVIATTSSVYVNRPTGLYALDAATGTVQWSAQLEASDGRCTPTATDARVFVGDKTGTVYAFDAETGTQQWTATVGYPVYASPRVNDGTVYVGPGRVHALDAETGAEQWVSVVGGYVSSPPVADGLLYAGGTDRVYGVDAATGDFKVKYQTGNVSVPPVIGRETLYVAAEGTMYALKTSFPNSSSGSPTQTSDRQSSPTPEPSRPDPTRGQTKSLPADESNRSGQTTAFPLLQVATGGAVLLCTALVAGLYRRRNDDESSSESADQASMTAGESRGTAMLSLRNTRNSPVICRVRCRTEETIHFQRDVKLGPEESASLTDLPDEQFEVAVKVHDGAVEKQIFSPQADARDVVIAVQSAAVDISRASSR